MRDGVHLGVLRDAGQADKHGDHGAPGKISQGVLEFLIGVLFKITQDARVELLFVKPRLEVNFEPVGSLAHIAHMRACREHQRPGNAEVCEEHFAKLPVDKLIIFISGERHILK